MIIKDVATLHCKILLFQKLYRLKAQTSQLLQQRTTTPEQNAVFAQSDGDRLRVEIGLQQCDIR